MENGIFSTWTLSFHLQTDWRRRRVTFTDSGKATPFSPSLGLGLFKPATADPFRYLVNQRISLGPLLLSYNIGSWIWFVEEENGKAFGSSCVNQPGIKKTMKRKQRKKKIKVELCIYVKKKKRRREGDGKEVPTSLYHQTMSSFFHQKFTTISR